MDAYGLVNGLCLLASGIAAKRGDTDELTSNSGQLEYANNVFAMRSYCWCDNHLPGHEEECPPNFEHFKSGLKVRWYKHASRCPEWNRPVGMIEWLGIVRECMESI